MDKKRGRAGQKKKHRVDHMFTKRDRALFDKEEKNDLAEQLNSLVLSMEAVTKRKKKLPKHEQFLSLHQAAKEYLALLSSFHKRGSSVKKRESTKPSILLVEDNILAQTIARNRLVELGCRVSVAESGKEAFEKSKKDVYDLIFMDIGLPDESGIEVARKIKYLPNISKDTPIVALTAHIVPKDKEKCMAAGMSAILLKPLSTAVASEILESFIPEYLTGEAPCRADDRACWLKLHGKTIDWALGEHLADGDAKQAQSYLEGLLKSFDEERTHLSKSYKQKDWKTLQKIVHKLRGGTSYCGTPRLEQALAHLEDYFVSGQRELIEPLYQQLVKEIKAFKKALHRGRKKKS